MNAYASQPIHAPLKTSPKNINIGGHAPCNTREPSVLNLSITGWYLMATATSLESRGGGTNRGVVACARLVAAPSGDLTSAPPGRQPKAHADFSAMSSDTGNEVFVLVWRNDHIENQSSNYGTLDKSRFTPKANITVVTQSLRRRGQEKWAKWSGRKFWPY